MDGGKFINMKIIIQNKLFLSGISDDLFQAIRERLEIQNPKWVENEKMGRWNGNTARLLRFYEVVEGGVLIPRGFAGQLISLCKQYGIKYQIIDKRRTLPEVALTFTGQLKPFQQEAVEAMLKREFGTLSAPTGSGKTVMALHIIAERKQPVLIVVHTKELLHQWINRTESFLGIPKNEIGIIGAGKETIGDRITVSLVQSLYKCAEQVSQYIGHLIIDECHRTPSRTFTQAVTAFDCKYMLGLSATPWRRDKLSRLIFWHLGDVHYKVDSAALVENGDILDVEIIIRETEFVPFSDPVTEYSKMLSELTQDLQRNDLICADIAEEARNGGGICLILSDRKNHCETFRDILLNRYGMSSDVLTGDISKGKRQDIVDRLNRGHIKILIATGQLIGEGFDCKDLSTLFMVTPIKFSGRVIQYLGRVLRPAPGKDKAKVFDYVDPMGVLQAAAKSRQKVYNRGKR